MILFNLIFSLEMRNLLEKRKIIQVCSKEKEITLKSIHKSKTNKIQNC